MEINVSTTGIGNWLERFGGGILLGLIVVGIVLGLGALKDQATQRNALLEEMRNVNRNLDELQGQLLTDARGNVVVRGDGTLGVSWAVPVVASSERPAPATDAPAPSSGAQEPQEPPE